MIWIMIFIGRICNVVWAIHDSHPRLRQHGLLIQNHFQHILVHGNLAGIVLIIFIGGVI
jgi:hypothetical protein